MFSGKNKSSFAILKLLSGSVGGTQRSSAQKKWTRSKATARALACLTVVAKNFCAMRPPESATQCVLPARLAASISSSHASAAARARSSALAKEIISKFCMKTLLAEQRDETGLLEISVGSQSLFQPALAHHHKRNAIRPAPVFVRALTEQFPSCRQQILCQRDDFDRRRVLQVSDEANCTLARFHLGQCVANLQQHCVPGHDLHAALGQLP